jgi:quercetin dioxygenase-like cupin family protein
VLTPVNSSYDYPNASEWTASSLSIRIFHFCRGLPTVAISKGCVELSILTRPALEGRLMALRLHLVMSSILFATTASTAHGQLEPSCVKDSPERRGEIGCSLVENKPLPEALKEPLFWHIDRFSSGDQARAKIDPTSVAFEAHGSWWLMTIEQTTNDHHGGRHVKQVKLPALPPAKRYSMLVMSAYIPAGLTSRIHSHSRVEGFYVVDGQQCLETPTRIYKMSKGGSLVIPASVTMRLVATGTIPRRALAVIVYDSSQPPTTRMEMEPLPKLASCKQSSD